MHPIVAVLSLSESFSQLWPKLAASSGAALDLAESVNGLNALSSATCVIIGAGGAEVSAISAIEELNAREKLPIAVVGIELDYRLVATLLRAGADNYFAMPQDLGALRSWVATSVEAASELERVHLLAADRSRRYDFSKLIGHSVPHVEALSRAARIIPRGNTTVLITGETGTGKELLARAIHYNGPRGSRPFVDINCTALPENLLEAELFGYEAGAFTDARAAKPGLIEAADQGTLFLDEIGDLSMTLQGKLLRVLEERRVRRLGSLHDRTLDIRIIAATHVDLMAALHKSEFRHDLYYRLSVLPIHLPPLRDRGKDVLELAGHFLDRFSLENGIRRPALTNQIQKALQSYPWPGNIRELRNAIERALLLGDGTLNVEDLFPQDLSAPPYASPALPFPASMNAISRAAARAMTEWCGGNKSEAAKKLGISRRHLYVLLANPEEEHVEHPRAE